jgi:hypothetical protein
LGTACDRTLLWVARLSRAAFLSVLAILRSSGEPRYLETNRFNVLIEFVTVSTQFPWSVLLLLLWPRVLP